MMKIIGRRVLKTTISRGNVSAMHAINIATLNGNKDTTNTYNP